ncbi:MAG: enoyl-CoA hydratase/isomerase family protein [Actinomycetota bacterium]|nr:enoyl-CoA hydratase/isomerase family protein [Actinomycetota bacterium]
MENQTKITFERRGHVALISLGIPGGVNPLDADLITELADAVEEVSQDSGIRCLVITGQNSSFGAGADLKNVIAMDVEGNIAYGKQLRQTFDSIAELPIPTIAAINGHALGGGLEVALACSIRISAEDLVLGLPEVKLGLIAAAGGIQRLIRTINRGPAFDLLVTGRMLRPDEAHRLGLVDRVVPKDELLDEALKMADRIAGNSPAAVRAVVELMRRGIDQPLDEAQAETDKASAGVLGSGEYLEGVSAFLEKRKPAFGEDTGAKGQAS